MPELLEVQHGFARALREADSGGHASRWLQGDADSIEQRLTIYRDNVVASATKALAAAHPVLRRVVGAEAFDGLVRSYQELRPSSSGDLNDYGADFASVLVASPRTRSMPCLPDLARLEWLVHRAYGAEDAKAWDPAELASLEPERQDSIRFDWAAGTAVFESAYPLARIWAIHQAGYEGEFSVDWSARETSLVAREGLHVTVSALAAGDAAFMVKALEGASLGVCAGVALEVDPGFDLGAMLSRTIAAGLVCGLTTATGH